MVHSDVLIILYPDLQILCMLAGNLTFPIINSDFREQKQCAATAILQVGLQGLKRDFYEFFAHITPISVVSVMKAREEFGLWRNIGE